jgi:excisionase family DNA binding protein
VLPEALTIRQAMTLTGLSRRTIGRMLADGRLAGAYKAGKEWRIPRTALDGLDGDTSTESPKNDDDATAWRERALVAEARLEATERTVDMLQESLTAMTTALQLANANAGAMTAPTAETGTDVVHVPHAPAARRRWRLRQR